MGKGSKIRRMAATLTLTASVLAPAIMVLGQAGPASAGTMDVVVTINSDPPDGIGLLLPAVQKVREAAGR